MKKGIHTPFPLLCGILLLLCLVTFWQSGSRKGGRKRKFDWHFKCWCANVNTTNLPYSLQFFSAFAAFASWPFVFSFFALLLSLHFSVLVLKEKQTPHDENKEISSLTKTNCFQNETIDWLNFELSLFFPTEDNNSI